MSTVLCDIDDVLWDLVPIWIKYLNKKSDKDMKKEDIISWNIGQYYPNLDKEELYQPLTLKCFWEEFEPKDDGIWFINKLKSDGTKLKLVTNTYYKNLHYKIENFFRCYPMISWDDITLTCDKQSVIGDFLIDDAPHNLIGGGYKGILMDKPHNWDFNEKEHKIKRVFDLYEAYEVINDYIKKGRYYLNE